MSQRSEKKPLLSCQGNTTHLCRSMHCQPCIRLRASQHPAPVADTSQPPAPKLPEYQCFLCSQRDRNLLATNCVKNAVCEYCGHVSELYKICARALAVPARQPQEVVEVVTHMTDAACRLAGIPVAAWPSTERERQRKIQLALDALDANHEWHKAHDEYDGYADSELCEKNTRAITELRTPALSSPVAQPPQTQQSLQIFWLDRTDDESGVSGIGRVAEGIVFSDGSCALNWLTKHKSWGFYPSLSELEKIHGHGGKTKVTLATEHRPAIRTSAPAQIVDSVCAPACAPLEGEQK